MHRRIRCAQRWLAFLVCVVLWASSAGCENRPVYTETDAKTRLTKLLRLYQLYIEKNNQGPANEEALRQFAGKLSAKELDENLIGNEIDSIFISSRDKQPFVVKYGVKAQPADETQALAWEATGENGNRYVALSTGYVEEYDDETFKEYQK